jgi:hypothetical protein
MGGGGCDLDFRLIHAGQLAEGVACAWRELGRCFEQETLEPAHRHAQASHWRSEDDALRVCTVAQQVRRRVQCDETSQALPIPEHRYFGVPTPHQAVKRGQIALPSVLAGDVAAFSHHWIVALPAQIVGIDGVAKLGQFLTQIPEIRLRSAQTMHGDDHATRLCSLRHGPRLPRHRFAIVAYPLGRVQHRTNA